MVMIFVLRCWRKAQRRWLVKKVTERKTYKSKDEHDINVNILIYALGAVDILAYV